MTNKTFYSLLSERGVTYAFDHRAKSGFARGEGTGCLILKPLSRAIEDNDKIWSVIRNTGINQDGRTVGITAPNPKAQEQLIREVYAKAGIDPRECGFVEAHGTGTKVGDPLEATAIHSVFGEGRTPRSPLFIGSVKSNIGHLEPTSGIVSMIKASLMLDKGFILPNANFEAENEAIPLAKWNMKVRLPLTQFIACDCDFLGGKLTRNRLRQPPVPGPRTSVSSASTTLALVAPMLIACWRSTRLRQRA